jgi:hypothetical protein
VPDTYSEKTKPIFGFAVCEFIMSLNYLKPADQSLPLALQIVSCCCHYFISRLLIKPHLSLESKSLLPLAVLGLLTMD